MTKPTFLNLPSDKRKQVEAAAIEAFATHGYEAASISRIVEQAGIAKGSFYQYFTDKQDLFLHLVDLAALEKQDFFKDRQPPNPGMDFFSYLRWLFEAGYAYAAVQSRLNQAVSRVLFGEGLFLGEAFRQMRETSSQMFAALIRQASQRGDIHPSVDPAVAAFVVETLLNALGMFILSQQQVSREELRRGSLDWLHSNKARQTIDQVLDILENGLGTGPQDAPAAPEGNALQKETIDEQSLDEQNHADHGREFRDWKGGRGAARQTGGERDHRLPVGRTRGPRPGGDL